MGANVTRIGSDMKACKKLFKGIPKISIRSVIVCLVVIFAVVLLIISMDLYINKPEQFGLAVPYIIGSIATICAVVSVVLALRSLMATEKTLELTRIIVRPFLAL